MTLLAFILGCVPFRIAKSGIDSQVRNDAILGASTATEITILLVPTLLAIPKRLMTNKDHTNAIAQAVSEGAHD